MDTVTIDGVEYVKALALAKKLKYTADYIGQLCRAHKVDAHLVGRTWYVCPPSIENHKSSRYAELRASEKTAKEPIKTTVSRLDVHSPVSKKIIRSHNPHFTHRVVDKTQAYENDGADLLPALGKNVLREVVSLPVALADSEKIKVHSSSKNISMVSQPLPAISLAGTLKVQNFETKYVFDEENDTRILKNDQIIGSLEKKPEKLIEKSEETRELKMKKVVGSSAAVKIHRYSGRVTHLRPRAIIPPPLSPALRQPLASKSHATNIAIRDAKKVPQLTVAKIPAVSPAAPANSLFFRLVVAPLLILVVLASALALISLENIVTVTNNGDRAVSWRLSAATISSILSSEIR